MESIDKENKTKQKKEVAFRVFYGIDQLSKKPSNDFDNFERPTK